MKFILHKPGSRLHPYSEPFIDRVRGKAVILKGVGQFGWEACEVFETRNWLETTWIKLFIFTQNWITNRRSFYRLRLYKIFGV